jgi:hypothetical protein
MSGSINGGAFLVAGDQEANRTSVGRFSRRKTLASRYHCGDASFHISCTTTMQ